MRSSRTAHSFDRFWGACYEVFDPQHFLLRHLLQPLPQPTQCFLQLEARRRVPVHMLTPTDACIHRYLHFVCPIAHAPVQVYHTVAFRLTWASLQQCCCSAIHKQILAARVLQQPNTSTVMLYALLMQAAKLTGLTRHGISRFVQVTKSGSTAALYGHMSPQEFNDDGLQGNHVHYLPMYSPFSVHHSGRHSIIACNMQAELIA